MTHDLLRRIKLIQETPELHEQFRMMYGTSYEMIEACIKEDMLKDLAVTFIKKLTDGFTSQQTVSVNTYSDNDGEVVSSVDYTISADTKRDILNALRTIRFNPLIESCQIDGYNVWGGVKLFDSTIDDKDRKEISSNDAYDFKSDIQRIIISKSGKVVLKAFNKWGNGYLTFEIE